MSDGVDRKPQISNDEPKPAKFTLKIKHQGRGMVSDRRLRAAQLKLDLFRYQSASETDNAV